MCMVIYINGYISWFMSWYMYDLKKNITIFDVLDIFIYFKPIFKILCTIFRYFKLKQVLPFLEFAGLCQEKSCFCTLIIKKGMIFLYKINSVIHSTPVIIPSRMSDVKPLMLNLSRVYTEIILPYWKKIKQFIYWFSVILNRDCCFNNIIITRCFLLF